jgi:hypothetical protein
MTATHIPLSLRIAAYLRRTESPQHYRVIAKHIQAPRLATYRACLRMLHEGRLLWSEDGTYCLPHQGGGDT